MFTPQELNELKRLRRRNPRLASNLAKKIEKTSAVKKKAKKSFNSKDIRAMRQFAAKNPDTAAKLQAMLKRKAGADLEDDLVFVDGYKIHTWGDIRQPTIEGAVELEMGAGMVSTPFDEFYDISDAEDDQGRDWNQAIKDIKNPDEQIEWLEENADNMGDSRDFFNEYGESVYYDDYYQEYRDEQARGIYEDLNMKEDLKEVLRNRMAEGLSSMSGKSIDPDGAEVAKAFGQYAKEESDGIDYFYYDSMAYSGEVYVPDTWSEVENISSVGGDLTDPAEWVKKNYKKIWGDDKSWGNFQEDQIEMFANRRRKLKSRARRRSRAGRL